MAVFLGIDAGTTNIKAVLLESDGRMVDSACAPTTVLRPFLGGCEMDMARLFEQLCTLTQTLRARNTALFESIAGVCVAAQGDGLFPVDSEGNPAGRAILWNDTRVHGFSDVDMDEVDAFLESRASTALFPGALPVLLKWLHENEPATFARIHKALHCKDWLNFKLTGVLASDHTDFSTAGIDIFSKAHVEELYDLLRIPAAKAMLPALNAPTDIVGTITREAAALTGIKEGVPVAAGAIDVVATALGAGLYTPGDCCTILGTTLCNFMLIDASEVNTKDRAGSALCSVFPNRYLRVMAANSGASTIDWAKNLLASDLNFEELTAALENVPPGSRGILYHPYIAGERAPFRDPLACGGFYGLSASHTRFDMMRAVYEGMVLSIMDCYRALPTSRGRLYLSGGGSVSGFTCRLIAGALNREAVQLTRRELAARGAVEIAKIALRVEQTDYDAGEHVFLPRADEREAFEAMYPPFVALRENMKNYWHERRLFCNEPIM
ncbi:carbohydrate kinase [Christensenellaceae bacterium OttesenSCG-928-L17]|nr:carbohydrate kinase [Christensenellaceae bacterium OttesenSCG-928-L17]